MEIVNRSSESSLFNIERIHPDLIVASETIPKGKHRVYTSDVDISI